MRTARVVAVAMFLAAASLGAEVWAQGGAGTSAAQAGGTGNIAGNWQGTLDVGKGQRIVLKVTREGATWHGVEYNLDTDRPYEGRNTTQMSVDGGVVRFAIAPIDGTYEGRLSADGASMAGQWTQGGQAHALTLTRAEGDAAWAIPEENKRMAKEADPDWEVVTVKLSDPDAHNSSLTMRGREVVMERRTVETMLLFAYGLQKSQIANAPEWIRTERFDVTGVPDVPGQASLKQMQSLVRKLLAERFGLATHTEQRELEVYALRAVKGAEKMTPSAGDPNGTPDERDNQSGGVVAMQMTNATMSDLALLLKLFYLDRPVVDQTGLAGRYDLRLRWTADETRAPVDETAPAGIFTAIQEQLGLKLERVKAMADVLVIDKVERPKAN